MNTRSECRARNYFLIGLLAGGAMGAALAMVCAPRVEGLRRRAVASAADLSDKAMQTYQDISARVTGAVDGLTAKGQSLGDDLAATIVDGSRHVEQLAMVAKTARAGRQLP